MRQFVISLVMMLFAFSATALDRAVVMDANDYVLGGEMNMKVLELSSSITGDYHELTEEEVISAKVLLDRAISSGENYGLEHGNRPRPLAQYAKQYIGFTKDGNTYVYVNLVLATLKKTFGGFDEFLVNVCDGGNAFGYAVVNLTEHKVERIMMNGDA